MKHRNHNHHVRDDPLHLESCSSCVQKEKRRLQHILQQETELFYSIQEESELYSQALRTKVTTPSPNIQADIEELRLENQSLQLKLDKLQEIKTSLDHIQRCDLVNLSISDLKNQCTYKISQSKEENTRLRTQIQVQNEALSHLRSTSTLTNVWTIQIEKYFATINSLVLGLGNPVDYVHLNAAFAECVLFLWFLRYPFKYYVPIPHGRESYFINREKKKFLLYASNEWSWKSRLNNGLHALLVCMVEYEKAKNIESKVPGRINLKNMTIDGVSLKFPSNAKDKKSQMNWNKACRYVLTHFKYYLLVAS